MTSLSLLAGRTVSYTINIKIHVTLFASVHEILLIIAYASNEGSDEPAFSQARQSLPCLHTHKVGIRMNPYAKI